MTLSRSSVSAVGLDSFAFRQFEYGYCGSYIPNYTPKQFLAEINKFIQLEYPELVSGYAPFCKHLFVPNFTQAKVSVIEITPENERYLKTGYISRRKEELPVLSRWFPSDCKFIKDSINLPAKYLDIILYSREQCEKEIQGMNLQGKHERLVEGSNSDPDWYIISIKLQNEDFETPMEPITMLRNTIIEEGGSGVPLDREKYLESVNYWKNHAVICPN
ncbi:uncharacterized protein CMU_036890 [Cryptosporidium muris RN66]|uniref:Uncharacterized protein n=1 Tax=Cryptosporidium muris (strain RN66) TaxID=441375 RepID=B6AH24_CRYMR|nr:uncharacterized protein CMU_036890 [Cryptosporidium muris RN66]EEA07515.1 hypothetical protein, conserved [Cryptosporidium muris RN66]|eukprot:XP_002141864.1 hypothetical protein [Cryptosporidium muris RN66]